MGESIYPPQAKAIIFLLTGEESLAREVLPLLEKILGPVEYQSPWFPFYHSNYYENELGPNLKRCLIGFKNIFEPEKLVELKQRTRELEQKLSFDYAQDERNNIGLRMISQCGQISSQCGQISGHGELVEPYPTLRRKINIDPGYVDLFKMVLASGKAGGQKVALSKDVYAYTLLRFEKEKWIPFEWTYPDFKEPIYHEDLLKIRKSLRTAITQPSSTK